MAGVVTGLWGAKTPSIAGLAWPPRRVSPVSTPDLPPLTRRALRPPGHSVPARRTGGAGVSRAPLGLAGDVQYEGGLHMGGLSAGVVFLAPAPPGLRLLCSPQATGFFECLLRIVRRVCLDFSNPLGEDHPRELQGVRAPLRSGSSTYQSRAGPPRAACRSASRLIIDPRLPSHPASWPDWFGVTWIPNPGWRRYRCEAGDSYGA